MTEPFSEPQPRMLRSASGLSAEVLAHGAIGRLCAGALTLNLFPGNALEGAPANLWLRCHGRTSQRPQQPLQATPLLGPRSPLTLQAGPANSYLATGLWNGLRLRLELRLAESASAWFWHLHAQNMRQSAMRIDLQLVQDVALCAYETIRLNEHYVSQYIDLSPLQHPRHGWLLAARQNLPVDGRHPWLLMGSLGRASAYATDALQFHGLALRDGTLPAAVAQGLPSSRLQHEHALIALQDARAVLLPGTAATLGFFGRLVADHAAATSQQDLALADATLALPEASPSDWAPGRTPSQVAGTLALPQSLFCSAPWLASVDLPETQWTALFGAERRHLERSADGQALSFFSGDSSHIVLRAKELCVQRPHGHILRSGKHLVPDESALTSTVWMGGVFHSMLTQGHVSINRFLSTQRSWLGLFRSHGQRVFVDTGSGWQQLGLPSAFEMQADGCRWLYQHAGGLLEVRSQACDQANQMRLQLRVLQGAPVRLLVSHHVALGGDDGSAPALPSLRVDAHGVFVGVPAGSPLAARFPAGGFQLAPMPGSHFAKVGDDGLLFADSQSRGQPFVCIVTGPVTDFGLCIEGRLTSAAPVPAGTLTLPAWSAPQADDATQAACAQLSEILPWYLHNALVHYLSPRGLEQFSGGGWGTRDVCQGPLEMLLALGHTAPVRDLLLRVFSAQNPDGDWPQWFSFFPREQTLRAGDSHGDVVFWPLVALARYLIANEDADLLDCELPFFTADDEPPQQAPLWQHVERALALIQSRCIAGTRLAAYGHGDWNDSLQPADPALREHMCSAWTVTLHHQMLSLMARAMRRLGRVVLADSFAAMAAGVRADFGRLLIADGVVAGYAVFAEAGSPALLLHPSDTQTGVHYSLLPMMHAILENMLSPEQAQVHVALIARHLTGPDGARLFDAPMAYRGGPQKLFQRAESSAFFGREIGQMYMHAHLRYAQMLAHMGMAQAFFDALQLAHPILIRERVPSATMRQANCYFSSSDAAFADRYQATAEYARIADGSIALDGGWRIYSGGPGIAIGLVVCNLLGWQQEKSTLVIDPVLPQRLDGLTAQLPLGPHTLEVHYRVGPQGFGPSQLELNGEPLPFSRVANPYRTGGAAVDMDTLTARLLPQGNRLLVCI